MKKEIELLERETTNHELTSSEPRQLGQPIERPSPDAIDWRVDGVVVGRLVAFHDAAEPLVTYPDQPGTAAIVARAAVDLYAEHIGQEVVLVFENGDPFRPIVTGRIRTSSPWPASDRPLQVDVDSEGRRLTVTAKEQLVLRCGRASITLTSAGKLMIQGAYVSSRSSGVLRIKGGSVQIN